MEDLWKAFLGRWFHLKLVHGLNQSTKRISLKKRLEKKEKIRKFSYGNNR